MHLEVNFKVKEVKLIYFKIMIVLQNVIEN